jgi:hypothetical protein
LSEKNDIKSSEQFDVEVGAAISPEVLTKRPFVEPEVSVPVDVLETTTFFQNNVESIGPLP